MTLAQGFWPHNKACSNVVQCDRNKPRVQEREMPAQEKERKTFFVIIKFVLNLLSHRGKIEKRKTWESLVSRGCIAGSGNGGEPTALCVSLHLISK